MRSVGIIQDMKKMVSSFNKSRLQPFTHFSVWGEKKELN